MIVKLKMKQLDIIASKIEESSLAKVDLVQYIQGKELVMDY
jgi:hypothetical protein